MVQAVSNSMFDPMSSADAPTPAAATVAAPAVVTRASAAAVTRFPASGKSTALLVHGGWVEEYEPNAPVCCYTYCWTALAHILWWLGCPEGGRDSRWVYMWAVLCLGGCFRAWGRGPCSQRVDGLVGG